MPIIGDPVTLGGNGGSGTNNLFEIDFSKAIESFSSDYVTINNGIASFTTTASYITMPFCGSGRTIEVDVDEVATTGTTTRRFIITGDSASGYGFGLRNNSEWGFWSGSWQLTGNTDKTIFDGKTVKVYIDSSNKWHVYRDGVLTFESTIAISQSSLWTIGGSGASQGPIGLSIKAVRIY